MKVSILTSSADHPIYPSLVEWIRIHESIGHIVEICTDVDELSGGDFLFMVSCSQVVSSATLEKYRYSLTLHASDLPHGRGWSPYIWYVLEGRDELVVTLLEASLPVDSGAIWLQEKIHLNGGELLVEIHEKLFQAECRLMSQAIESVDSIVPSPQSDAGASWYRRRSADDSELDVSKSLKELFNQLRVADNQRFPAFFRHANRRYKLTIEVMDDD